MLADDIGQQVAAQHGITLYASVRDALTLGGGRRGLPVGGETKDDILQSTRVGVDAVLLIAEHGEMQHTGVWSKSTLVRPCHRCWAAQATIRRPSSAKK